MIFLHLIIGIFLGMLFGNYQFFIIGAIFADIDHIYIYFIKARLFKWKKFIDALKYEKKYGIRSKTPFVHSILGMIVFSAIVFLFSKEGALAFFIGYLSHLVLDAIDTDEMQIFYPLKFTFHGFLPVWSNAEKVITAISVVALVVLFIL